MSKRCVECGHKDLQSVTPELYQYKVSGLEDIYLKGGVTQYICPKCGSRSTKIKNVVGLHRVIADSLAKASRRLNGAELRFLRENIGYSGKNLADLIDINEDYLRKIENGSKIPKASYEWVLRTLTLLGHSAPSYEDLLKLASREYKLEKLQFTNKDKAWEQELAA